MIKYVYSFGRKKFLEYMVPHCHDLQVPIYLITICGPESKELIDYGSIVSSVLSLNFDNASFDVVLAEKILYYLRDVHHRSSMIPGKEVLVVQCDDGQSRSPAIAKIANEFFGLKEDDFYKFHVGLVLDAHVYHVLKNVYMDNWGKFK